MTWFIRYKSWEHSNPLDFCSWWWNDDWCII